MTVTRKEVHFSSVNMLEGNGFLLHTGPVVVNGAALVAQRVKQSAYNALILGKTWLGHRVSDVWSNSMLGFYDGVFG